MTAQVNEDEEKKLQIYQNELSSLKKILDSLSIFGTKEFIYFLIILLALILLVIIPPKSYVELIRSHGALQNRILSLFLLYSYEKQAQKRLSDFRKVYLQAFIRAKK